MFVMILQPWNEHYIRIRGGVKSEELQNATSKHWYCNAVHYTAALHCSKEEECTAEQEQSILQLFTFDLAPYDVVMHIPWEKHH